jgi:hypothetical protein
MRNKVKSLASRHRPWSVIIWARLILTISVALISVAASNQDNVIQIDIEKPAAHWLAAGTTDLLAPEPSNGLAQIPDASIGWFDYDLPVKRTSWYRLLVDASPHLARTEFLVDGAGAEPAVRLERSTPSGNGRFDAGWVWLTQGTHRLRVRNLIWTGFPKITRIQFEAAPPAEAFVFRLLPPEKTVFAIGTCAPLEIEAGGNATAFAIDVTFRTNNTVSRRRAEIPASALLVRRSINVPCDSAGDLAVDLRSSSRHGDLSMRAQTTYAVFDTSPAEATYGRGELVADIDMVNRPPDFQAGETPVVAGSMGAYRTSGENGSTPYIRYKARSLLQRLASLERSKLPNWFAYSVEGLVIDQPHLIEVEYPDDEPRAFVVALRFSNGRGYPISIGAETGVVWPLTHRMAKMSALVWPSSSDGRVMVFNIHNGMKAAVARVRIYKAVARQTSRPQLAQQGRDFLFWAEEGDNFRDVVGESHEPDAVFKPVDRYLSLARSTGASIVSPTVAIYNFAMYPSRFHLTFDDGGRDMTAAFMLSAERYGLKIVPQLHPRADELVWPPRNKDALGARLLLSNHGEHHFERPNGDFFRPPFYNPLNPDIRRWYVEMVAELADRYKDYPAFGGIDLRVSNWQNPSLNNLESMEWGYDADTVARFLSETGIAAPVGLDIRTDRPAAAKARYRYLVGKYKVAWTRWRCEKITDIYRDIAAHLRAARSDLRLYVSLFGERTWNAETMREFGIDVDLLKAIDGVTLVDVRLGHGAQEAELDWRRTEHADLITPDLIGFISGAERPSIVFPMAYIELTGNIATAEAIGLPVPGREPRVSSAMEPPGRLSLARFATAVGLADPYLLGDGGNGYVFGNDRNTLGSFMAEFRTLPRRPFERVSGIPDAIIVRQSEDMLYVVNMLGVSLSARLRPDGSTSIRRAVSGEVLPASDGTLPVDLEPYAMASFAIDKRRHIVGAEVLLGVEAGQEFENRAASARQSASRECSRLLNETSCAEAKKRSQEIDAAIAHGSYWTAERLLQSEN